ncbi:MAG: transposase [Candidatus Babeliales bacterium]
MARKLRMLREGYVYHVTQRGNNKTNLFYSHVDYLIFLKYLLEAKKLYPCHIYGYCLMTNHYHLLLEALERNNISLLMKHLNGKYAMYINAKCKRTGTLFEGRFKAGLVQYDQYLCRCHRYIDINPVKAGIVQTPDQYPWSSYNFYANKEPNSILDYDLWYLSLGDTFEERRAHYAKLVNSKTDASHDEFIEKQINKNGIIGSDAYIKKMTSEFSTDISPKIGVGPHL